MGILFMGPEPSAAGDDLATKNRNDTEKRMTPEQIAEAKKLSREWRPLPVAPSARSDDAIDCKNHELLADTDPARALAACLRLAEKGNAAAEFSIGQMHESGHGVQQDDTTAAFWYRKAADQGLPIAQSSLGRLFYKGIAAPDFVTAAKWFRKAADQGDVDGQTYLGTMYARGQGLPIDYVQAYIWYTLAIKWGNSGASRSRDLLAQVMSPAQIAIAKQLAAQWKPKEP